MTSGQCGEQRYIQADDVNACVGVVSDLFDAITTAAAS